MQVTLIDYTGNGHPDPSRYAGALLLFTKSTRLDMRPDGMETFLKMPADEFMAELEKVAKTIRSSWEFIHYTFLIQNCTRAFANQLVRTRTASYAQQTLRMLDVSGGFTYETPPTIDAATDGDAPDCYHDTMEYIQQNYTTMVEQGIPAEDARGILPLNIHTNIVMGANLRTFADLISKRSSGRVQGEYRAFVGMVAELIAKVHPWTKMFILGKMLAYGRELDDMLDDLGLDANEQRDVWKLVDNLRGANQ